MQPRIPPSSSTAGGGSQSQPPPTVAPLDDLAAAASSSSSSHKKRVRTEGNETTPTDIPTLEGSPISVSAASTTSSDAQQPSKKLKISSSGSSVASSSTASSSTTTSIHIAAARRRQVLEDLYQNLGEVLDCEASADRPEILQAAIDQLQNFKQQEFVFRPTLFVHGFPSVSQLPNLENIPTAYLTLDGKFADVNQAFLTLFNWNPGLKVFSRPANTPYKSKPTRSNSITSITTAAGSVSSSSAAAAASSSSSGVLDPMVTLRRHMFTALLSPPDLARMNHILTVLLQSDTTTPVDTSVTFMDFTGHLLDRCHCILSPLRQNGVLKLLQIMCVPETNLEAPPFQMSQQANVATSPPTPTSASLSFTPDIFPSTSGSPPMRSATTPLSPAISSQAYLQQARLLQDAASSKLYPLMSPVGVATSPPMSPPVVISPSMAMSPPNPYSQTFGSGGAVSGVPNPMTVMMAPISPGIISPPLHTRTFASQSPISSTPATIEELQLMVRQQQHQLATTRQVLAAATATAPMSIAPSPAVGQSPSSAFTPTSHSTNSSLATSSVASSPDKVTPRRLP